MNNTNELFNVDNGEVLTEDNPHPVLLVENYSVPTQTSPNSDATDSCYDSDSVSVDALVESLFKTAECHTTDGPISRCDFIPTVTDIPIATREYHRLTRLADTDRLDLLDHEHWVNGYNDGNMSDNFVTNIQHFADDVSKVVFFSRKMNIRDRKTIAGEVGGLMYSTYISWINAQDLMDERFTNLPNVLMVREYLGVDDEAIDFVAENDAVDNFTAYISKCCRGLLTVQYTDVMLITKEIFNSIYGTFATMLSYVSDLVTQFLALIRDKCMTYIVKSILPEMSLFEDIHDAKETIVKCIVFVSIALIGALGVVSTAVALKMMRPVASMQMSNFVAEADSGASAVALISAMALGAVGLASGDIEKIKKHCMVLTALMAGGTVLSNIFATLFVLLPSSMRTAFVLKFGSESDKQDQAIEDWRVVAEQIVGSSRIASILGTPLFSARVKECVRQARKMLPHVHKSHMKNYFFLTFQKVFNLYMMINQKEFDAGNRKLPFAIHIAGAPGVGKSLLTANLIQKVFEEDELNTYYRSNVDEFWSGYNCQQIVVMDEWGVGDSQYRTQTGKEYLALVSVASFNPPMASVDNPQVGIKGTVAKPKAVITLNNEPYDNFQNVSRSALQRRRQCVIMVDRRDGSKSSKVDLKGVKPADIASASWAKFAIMPSEGKPDWDSAEKTWMDFDTLCATLKTMYSDHQIECRSVAEALGGRMNDEATPSQIMDEVLRCMMGITDLPLQETDEDFLMESPGKANLEDMIYGRVSCTHKCCREWTHLVYAGDKEEAACHKCGAKEVCQRPEPQPQYDPESKVHNRTSYLAKCADDWFQSGGLVCPTGYIRTFTENRKHVYAGLIATGIAMVSAIYMAKRLLYDNKEEVTFGEESAKPNKSSHPARKTRTALKRGFKAEGLTDLPVVDLLMPDGHIIHTTPINERNVLTYYHGLYPYIRNSEEVAVVAMMKVNNAMCEFEVLITPNDVSTSHDEFDDIMVVRLDNKRIPQFRDIRRRFATFDQINRQNTINVTVQLANGMYHTNGKIVHQRGYLALGTKKTLSSSILYTATSQEGDCGSLLTCVGGPLAGKIVGMHVAGNKEKGHHDEGLATLVCVELFGAPTKQVVMQTEGPGINFERFVGPNVERLDYVEGPERVYLPTKSKIEPSDLQDLLSIPTTKEPAILDSRDPRANGQNPIENSLVNLFGVNHVEVDEQLVAKVADSVASQYEQTMNQVVEPRELTFEEGVFGIPGVLASLNTTTSAGWPLCRIVRKGKTELFWFDEAGEPNFDPEFKKMVLNRVDEIKKLIKEGNNEIIHDEAVKYHKFIGFLKDETISKAKIGDVKTRMIFANDVVAVCAFRMLFGSVLANLNNSYATTPLAIGYNQYSHDIQEMYDYLVNNNIDVPKFIAGDYKAFDQHMHPVFLREAYKIIIRLAKLNSGYFSYLYAHETQAPAQIGPVLFKTVSNHMSGCFFTSPINCLVNEMYMRYCFKKRFPTLLFEDYVRCKFLGDDHILAIKPELDWTPLKLGIDMKEIGQTYTSADKGAALRDECDTFDEITFLGAHPRVVNGSYSGAAKKAMLYETPQWTRDHGVTTPAVVRQCCELASQWDQEFFYEYCGELRAAMKLKGVEWLVLPGYQELSETVAGRKAGTENTFVSEGSGVPGLTEINTATPADSKTYAQKSYVEHAKLGLNEQAMELDYGLNSNVWRQTYDWVTTDVEGTKIFEVQAPHGLLALGDPNNLQNIPFQRYIFFHTDVELTVQIAGTPFQAGLLCLNFTPLDTQSRGSTADQTQMPHILLSPNRNATGTLNVPFRFFRNVMNTYADSQELLGTFTLTVISPLNVNNDDLHVSVNIFSRFVNAKFTIPRPVPSAEMLELRKAFNNSPEPMDWTSDTTIQPRKALTTGLATYPEVMENSEFVSEGGGASKSSNINNYDVKNVYDHTSIGGSVPQQLGGATTSTTRAGASVDADLEISPTVDMPIPMDNPTLAGSTVPTNQAFSGMSKNRGLKPTTKMGFNHDLDDLHHNALQEPAETNIASLCTRPSIVGIYSWSNTQVDGTVIAKWPLNSMLQYINNQVLNNSIQLGIVNKFRFWRADIEFEFRAVRTSFHNGRCMFTVAYGAPESEVTPSNKNIFLNNVLEFVGENDVVSVTVPYNSATEYLTTTQGTGTNNPIQDSSLGTVMITVLNQLKSASTVADAIEIVVYSRLKNLEVYEINPGMTSTIVAASGAFYPWVTATTVSSPPELVAEGPGETLNSGVQVANETSQIEPVVSTDITATETELAQNAPYENDYFRKFPCLTRSVYEIERRYHRINTNVFTQREFKNSSGGTTYMLQIPIMPMSEWANLYGAWAGSLNFRIYSALPVSDNDVGLDSLCVAINNAVNVELEPGTERFGPAGDPGWMSGSGQTEQIPSDPTYTITQNFTNYPSVPIEQRYSIVYGKQWIDVNIPFSTIFQMLPTPFTNATNSPATPNGFTLSRASVATGINPYIGWLGLLSDNPITPATCQLYQSVGDDFRYFAYQAGYAGVAGYSADTIIPVAPGFQINGFALE